MPYPRSSSPRRIAVIGVGKIGSTFAYQFARAGHDVTVIARPDSARLAQLRRDGAIVLQNGEQAAVTVQDGLDAEADYDVVIVTVLAHQVEALLPTLARSRAPIVHFMFVTFQPGRLSDALGARASFGMPAVTATLDADGRLRPSIGRQRTQHGDQRMVDLFAEAGLPSALEPNMPLWLRCHVSLTAAMEAVSAWALERGRGARWGQARIGARGARAGLMIVAASGEKPYPRSKRMMSRGPLFPLTFMLWFLSRINTFRTLLGQGDGEARALIDSMLKEAGSRPELVEQVKVLRELRPAAASGAARS